ncbi:hypothetical protein PAGU2196_49780 [Pseudomonas sp. PAGU 2196]|nr:hypothetical protein PAGU2196_49780 [Pseudomonas sp. PAGU 2196]
MRLGCVRVSSLQKAAPEEKRSAFYGLKRNWGRGKHDGGMIGVCSLNKLTFKSVFGAQKSPPKRAFP